MEGIEFQENKSVAQWVNVLSVSMLVFFSVFNIILLLSLLSAQSATWFSCDAARYISAQQK